MWERCSLATPMARFHAPVRDIPASYLETVLSDPSASVVAVHERTCVVAALASLVPDGSGSAELACWCKTPVSATGSAAGSSRT